MNATTDVFDTLLRSPPHAFCERILCLERGSRERHWWTTLVDPANPLFDPPGRLRQVSFEHCQAEVERTVESGCRPLLFVARPVDWPEVYEALGRYRHFARLYVRGRDNDTMRDLLHQPAPEILAAYRGQGRLLVPDLDYGKALDRLLPVWLSDFLPRRAGLDQGPVSAGVVHVHSVSRLNAYRWLDVRLDAPARMLRLTQTYRPANGRQAAEPCDLPIECHGLRLRFADGQCRLDATQEELAAAVVAWLELPLADTASWIAVLAERLARLTDGAGAFLSQSLQVALAGIARSREALDVLWSWIDARATAPVAPVQATAGVRVCGVPEAHRTPLPLTLLVTGVRAEDQGLRLSLDWRPETAPWEEPEVAVSVARDAGAENIAAPRIACEWAPDRTNLLLRIQGLDLQQPEIAWQYDEEDNRLELRLRAGAGTV